MCGCVETGNPISHYAKAIKKNYGIKSSIQKSGIKSVNGIFLIKGDEDLFILKYYLENEWLLIPENCPLFADWIEDN